MLVYVYEYVCVDICMCLCTRIYENICGERVYNFFLSPSLCASLNVSVYPAHSFSLHKATYIPNPNITGALSPH